MYLSRVILNQRSRAVRRDLANHQQLHRTVMSVFPDDAGPSARSALQVLYRLEAEPRSGAPSLLIQSSIEPEWSRLPQDYTGASIPTRPNPEVKSVTEQYRSLRAGMRLRFRLVANPTRKIDTRSGADGHRRHGRRVELRGEEATLMWLERKATQHGFRLTRVAAADVPNTVARPLPRMMGVREDRPPRQPVTLVAVLFEGELQITDFDAFLKALFSGIGPGRAYGCGLLSIAPPSP